MRQSRKKWERRREVHRNKLAAVIFVIMMIAFCVVNLATGDREFSATENPGTGTETGTLQFQE